MNEAEIIGNRIKILEQESEGELLSPNKPFVIRLDGHGFSKFTRQFQKPLDSGLKEAMINTAGDLLDEFSARIAFTESDEITLLFPPIPNPESTLIFKGRKQKLCSLTAGFASARFNYHLSQFVTDEKLASKIGLAYFDARVFSVENEKEGVSAVRWRYEFDTFRNGVMGLAQTIFSSKQLHKKSLGEVMKMLKDKRVMLNEQDPHLLYGTFIKKELFEHTGFDPKTQKKVKVMRSRIKSDQVKLCELTEEEQKDFVFRKYW